MVHIVSVCVLCAICWTRSFLLNTEHIFDRTLSRFNRESRRRRRGNNNNGFDDFNDYGSFSDSVGSISLLPDLGSQYASGGDINDFRIYNPSSNTGQYLTNAFLNDNGGGSSLDYTGSSSFYFRI